MSHDIYENSVCNLVTADFHGSQGGLLIERQDAIKHLFLRRCSTRATRLNMTRKMKSYSSYGWKSEDCKYGRIFSLFGVGFVKMFFRGVIPLTEEHHEECEAALKMCDF